MGLVDGETARRVAFALRPVTREAASVGSMAASASLSSASAASAAIVSHAAFCGLVVPPSQRFIVAKETPSRSASCCWVRSSLALMARRVD